MAWYLREVPKDELTIAGLCDGASSFERELKKVKSDLAAKDQWYPYDTLGNVFHLRSLLPAQYSELGSMTAGLPVADFGAADGDLAFFLASRGLNVDIVDWGPTNWNGLRGARLLAQRLQLPVSIFEVDLDTQFTLPRERYGLALFLGILYHLQNPFYALRTLAERTSYCLLSTRVARVVGRRSTSIADLPLAYLLDPDESNNDSTNYWIFSPAGLRRICARAGWTVLNELFVGRTKGDSNPSSPNRDERAYLLLSSKAHVSGEHNA